MEHLNFGTQLLTLCEIFNEQFFVIPDYQRGYAWEKKQVEELLNDIKHLMDDGVDLKHYTGTIVLSQPDNTSNEYHVVDGQQRLTTLSVVLHVLSTYLSGDEKSNFIKKYLWRGEIGSEQAVLTLNKDTRKYFENVIITEHESSTELATLEAHNRLLECKQVTKKWFITELGDASSLQRIKTIQNTIENELGFLVYAPKEDDETGVMFEVINNRGKGLSELEKVKNYLIYCSVKLKAKTLRKKIDDGWSEILFNLNAAKKIFTEDEAAFLRYCVTVYFSASKNEGQYGYNLIKERFNLDVAMHDAEKRNAMVQALEAFVEFLKHAALWYARLYGRVHNGLSNELLPVLDKLRGQERHASIMPLFLALTIKQGQAPTELARLLNLVEILNFRVYMAKGITPRNDTGQADLFAYAAQYYHNQGIDGLLKTLDDNELDISTEEQALEYRLVYFTQRHSPESKFKQSFVLEQDTYDDFYNWTGIRYFLMNYEAELQPNRTIDIDKILKMRAEGKSADYYSVEHVWASNNRSEDNNRPQDKFQKRRLGNFTLLEFRINSKISNADISEKIDTLYEASSSPDVSHLVHVQYMCEDGRTAIKELEGRRKGKDYYKDISDLLNDKQEKRYIDFATQRWSTEHYFGNNHVLARLEAETVSD